jgi:polysaccharide export outer membrane protein
MMRNAMTDRINARLPGALGGALLALLCAGAAQAQTAGGDGAPAPSDAPRPGDVVRVKIWQEPDLSGDFTVDRKGIVVLPRLGPWDVSSESAETLEAKLIEAYTPFLKHTSIDVTLLRRIQILGAVRNPGLYPVDPTMTLSDALAAAGGATEDGRSKKVELIRGGRQLSVDLSGDTRLADASVRSGDQLYVPERSWFSRNAAFLGGAITGVLGLAIAIAR